MIEIRLVRRRDINHEAVSLHIENTVADRSTRLLERFPGGRVPADFVESILRHYVRVGEIPA
jgi:hypothetical protein